MRLVEWPTLALQMEAGTSSELELLRPYGQPLRGSVGADDGYGAEFEPVGGGGDGNEDDDDGADTAGGIHDDGDAECDGILGARIQPGVGLDKHLADSTVDRTGLRPWEGISQPVWGEEPILSASLLHGAGI